MPFVVGCVIVQLGTPEQAFWRADTSENWSFSLATVGLVNPPINNRAMPLVLPLACSALFPLPVFVPWLQ